MSISTCALTFVFNSSVLFPCRKKIQFHIQEFGIVSSTMLNPLTRCMNYSAFNISQGLWFNKIKIIQPMYNHAVNVKILKVSLIKFVNVENNETIIEWTNDTNDKMSYTDIFLKSCELQDEILQTEGRKYFFTSKFQIKENENITVYVN